MFKAMSARELHKATRDLQSLPPDFRSDPKTPAKTKLASVAVDLLEIDGSLFAWGLVAGRFGVVAPLGVSLDLLLGLLLGTLGTFEIGGPKLAPHLLNLGTASLGSFAMRKGVQVGTQLRTSASLPALGAADLGSGIFGSDFARGALGTSAPRDLTQAELAAMAAATRRAA